MPAKGQLTSALILDWFLTRFHWLCDNQDDNLVQWYISGQLRLTIIQCRCICTSTCTVSPDLSNFLGNLGIRNLFKGGWSRTKDSLFNFIYLAVPFWQSWLKSTVQTTVLVPNYETGWCTFYGVVELRTIQLLCALLNPDWVGLFTEVCCFGLGRKLSSYQGSK